MAPKPSRYKLRPKDRKALLDLGKEIAQEQRNAASLRQALQQAQLRIQNLGARIQERSEVAKENAVPGIPTGLRGKVVFEDDTIKAFVAAPERSD